MSYQTNNVSLLFKGRPAVYLEPDENNNLQIYGLFGEIWKDLEETLNFTTVYSMEETSVSETLEHLRKEKVHVAIGHYTITAERAKSVDFSIQIMTARCVLALALTAITFTLSTLYLVTLKLLQALLNLLLFF